MMLIGFLFAAYFSLIALLALFELRVIARAADAEADALCDEHDWKVEDRNDRTIDDLPPGKFVD